MKARQRLASYGTLAPGRSNYAQVEGLGGRWLKGIVHGKRIQAGWGTWEGYPGLVLDPKGEAVEVFILESEALPDHWERLDAFEGKAYSRVITTAQTDEGPLEVSLYETKPEQP